MTTKLKQAARQILEAVEGIGFVSDYWNEKITALREALAEQAEQEPVGYLCEASFGRGQVFWFNKPADNTPLYAAPVRTKDLTDDEIMKINVDTAGIVPTCDRQFHFARAVIAADREKNK